MLKFSCRCFGKDGLAYCSWKVRCAEAQGAGQRLVAGCLFSPTFGLNEPDFRALEAQSQVARGWGWGGSGTRAVNTWTGGFFLFLGSQGVVCLKSACVIIMSRVLVRVCPRFQEADLNSPSVCQLFGRPFEGSAFVFVLLIWTVSTYVTAEHPLSTVKLDVRARSPLHPRCLCGLTALRTCRLLPKCLSSSTKALSSPPLLSPFTIGFSVTVLKSNYAILTYPKPKTGLF